MGGRRPGGRLRARAARGRVARSSRRTSSSSRGAAPSSSRRPRRAGVQLRFEASVCAAIPVIKVLRESLVVTNVHRVLGIVNGTTNFILSAMERGPHATPRRSRRRSGSATPRPTRPTTSRARRRREDRDPRDGRVRLARAARLGRGRGHRGRDARARRGGAGARHARQAARARDARRRTRRRPRRPGARRRHHPLAAVEGAFNAVMLQGDAIREITLEGPGAGGIETASAVVADLVSDRRHDGHRLPPGRPGLARARADAAGRARVARGTCASRSRTAPACSPGSRTSSPRRASRSRGSSSSRVDGDAVLHVVTHEAPAGRVEAALAAIRALPSRAARRARSRSSPSAASRSSAGRDRRLGADARLDFDRAAMPLIERFRDRLPVTDGDARSSRSARARRRFFAAPRLAGPLA